jgi:UDP-N-acetylglucosamine--N-acetylmuramyl-(pentapeptide) pyrophosphoryl-undecaprenol N-acetylglucosamine transferase
MRPARRSPSTTPTGAAARIALACGGTGGDVLPAIAVAQRLPEHVEPLILGDPSGLARRLAAEAGHRFLATPSAPFARTTWGGKMRSLGATAIGTMKARRLLGGEAVRLVVGFGAYASVPPGLAAWSLGIPLVLFEANADPGRANRLLDRVADRVLVGTPAASAAFRTRAVVTGVPLRRAVLGVTSRGPHTPLRVHVSGGSFGSPFLDTHVPALLARITAGGVAVEVHHLGDVARARAAYAAAKVHATVAAYMEDMAAEYAWADVAIVSAGATTLAELAAVGLPAIVVPLAAAARDHQTPNARAFAEATGVPWSREDAWDEARMAAHLTALATSPSAWTAAASRLRRLACPDAAEAVVRACLETLHAAR